MEEQKRKHNRTGLVLWLAAAIILATVSGVLLYFSASEDGYAFPVYLNEVLASNTAHPNPDGRCCDYMELYNSADYPVDLTGFQLGDIAGSSRYAFPAGTTIPGGGYLVVYCDQEAEDASYAPFAISRAGGEAFYLIASNNAIVDSVVTVASEADQAMVRLDADRWGLSSLVTPGWSNSQAPQAGQELYNPQVSPVRVTELSAEPTGYVKELGLFCDWVELCNTSGETVDISGFSLSDNVGNDKFIFPQGSVLAPGEYRLVYCAENAPAPSIAPFGISQYGGESLVLKDSAGRIIEIVDTLPMDSGGSMVRSSQGIWENTQDSSPGFENSPQGCRAFQESIGAVPGGIQIRELMAAEQNILPDGNGAFPDWVEIYNSLEVPVDLSGWFLSDDPQDPDKWVFPAVTLEPGEYLTVFCSGAESAGEELHAGFSLSAGGESLILSSYLGTAVDAVTFGASEAGQAYAFRDGTGELTEYPTPGYPNDMAGYEAFCAARTPLGPLAIWEAMPTNDWYLPQALGECYDWVELKNVSDTEVFLGDYCLSDDREDPGLYPLPEKTLAPGELMVIILSGDVDLSDGDYAHAPFSLSAAGDNLYLFSREGKLLDFTVLKEIPMGSSWGRMEEGGFGYMTPTPEAENAPGCRLISAQPLGNFAPGVYTGEESYTVTLEAPGKIYYTLDGSDPSDASQIYDGPIEIKNSAVLRAVAVEEGRLTSGIYTATFLMDRAHSTPVVSLVTDPDNLWSKKTGIYKNGDISIKEEKRPANLSYTGEDGNFSLDCEISLHGATTVTAFDKKSFTVRFQDSYDGPLYFDVFGDGRQVYSSLLIRTAHESTFSTQMHDALMGQFAAENCPTLISQRFRYVALYINGEYWGIYALRDQHSVEHYADTMDVPADTVHMTRKYIEYGTSLYDLYKFCGSNSLRSPENYAYAQSLLDMSSFVDWIILEAYVGNLDINGNMRYYYCSVDGKWRCGLADVDLGMFSKKAFDLVADAFHHGRLVSALMENETFQDLLAARLAQLLSGPLADEAMIARIDEMAAILRPETPYEYERWNTPVLSWELLVEDMKEYCDGRSQRMIQSLCQELHFTQQEKEQYFGDLLK